MAERIDKRPSLIGLLFALVASGGLPGCGATAAPTTRPPTPAAQASTQLPADSPPANTPPANTLPANTLPANTLPATTLSGLNGQTYTLSARPGRVLVLDFMSSWCQTCVEALPGVQRLAAKWQRRGVQVWVVSTDEDRADLEAVLKRVPVALPVVLDSAEAWFKHFKLASVPTAVVINPAGQVVATVNEPPGKASYEDAIDAALQQVVKAP